MIGPVYTGHLMRVCLREASSSIPTPNTTHFGIPVQAYFLMFSLLLTWKIVTWTNSRIASDLRRHHVHVTQRCTIVNKIFFFLQHYPCFKPGYYGCTAEVINSLTAIGTPHFPNVQSAGSDRFQLCLCLWANSCEKYNVLVIGKLGLGLIEKYIKSFHCSGFACRDLVTTLENGAALDRPIYFVAVTKSTLTYYADCAIKTYTECIVQPSKHDDVIK